MAVGALRIAAAAVAAAARRRAAMAAAADAASAAAGVSDDDDELREWLLHSAMLHKRFVGKVLEVLEQEEVATVRDLDVLVRLPRFDACGFSAVTAEKIRAALVGMASSDASAAQHVQAAHVVLTPSSGARSVSRVRSGMLTPTAPKRQLFASPPRVEARDEEHNRSRAAVTLQAAAQRWLARARFVAARRAAVRLQAGMRGLLATWRRRDEHRSVSLRGKHWWRRYRHLFPYLWRERHERSAGRIQYWWRDWWERRWMWPRRRAVRSIEEAWSRLLWRRSLVCVDVPAWFWTATRAVTFGPETAAGGHGSEMDEVVMDGADFYFTCGSARRGLSGPRCQPPQPGSQAMQPGVSCSSEGPPPALSSPEPVLSRRRPRGRKGSRRGRFDLHLPPRFRYEWADRQALDDYAAWIRGEPLDEYKLGRLSRLLCRVLARPPEMGGPARGTELPCPTWVDELHDDDLGMVWENWDYANNECDPPGFDLRDIDDESVSRRRAVLLAEGWPRGDMPTWRELREHMLYRVELHVEVELQCFGRRQTFMTLRQEETAERALHYEQKARLSKGLKRGGDGEVDELDESDESDEDDSTDLDMEAEGTQA